MNQTCLDFTAAKAARDEGLQRVTESNATWMDHALASLSGYLRLHETIRIEEFRAWWEAVGGESPSKPNAWGALGRIAVTRGMADVIDFVPAQSIKTHGHRVALYRSKLYRMVA